MPPILSVVIVNWNVRDLLARALESIRSSWPAPESIEVIVVDNASQDGSADMVRSAFPAVHLIASGQNRGFTGGNNLGIRAATGEYVLLLNPDTEIVADALGTMVTYLQEHPDVALVGPKLLDPDGSPQSSRRRFPSLSVLFLESTWLQSLLPRRRLQQYYVDDVEDSGIQDVDWVTGAAMMVRREVIETVGLLDEGFFMYCEELDWCRRIRSAGWRIVYVPAAQVIHYGGKSSDQVVAARHIYFQSSKVRYTRKHHGRWAAEVLRLWLLGQYVWQYALEWLKWLSGHRRALRKERLHAYSQVIQSKLKQP